MRVTTSYLERVARDWQKAYREANSRDAPAVVWEHGWFKIDSKRYRRATLEDMTNTLRRVAELSQGSKND
jgi:hypothetical protein